MNLYLLYVLIFEIVFLVISFVTITVVYQLTFLESINIVGNISSIKGLLYAIMFLMFNTRHQNYIKEAVVDIHRVTMTSETRDEMIISVPT